MPYPSRADVLADLSQLHFSTPQEQADLAGFVAFVQDTPAPFARSTLAGHVTASALLLDPAGTHLAMIWHAKSGRYLEPGGHCEPADASVQAAMWRELEEETGVRPGQAELLSPLPVHLESHPIAAYGHEPAHRHYDVRYGLRLREPYHSDAVKWVALDQLEEPGLQRAVALVQALLPEGNPHPV